MTIRTVDVRVFLDGEPFTLWKSVTVHRSVEQLAGGFSLDLAAFHAGFARPGREIEVREGDAVLIRGRVERVNAAKAGDAHSRKMDGRDKTADLIDCSAVVKSYDLSDVSLEEIFEQVAGPFGIKADFDAAGTGDRFKRFAISPGETAWSAIERACRLRGMLAYTSPLGVVQIRRGDTGVVPYSLVDGSNLLDWGLTIDHAARFATYVVRGSSPGDNDTWGAAVAQVDGIAADDGVGRYRPLEIVAEGNVSKDTAELRAQWEATVRAARSEQITIEVPGWRVGQWIDEETREPWQINQRIPVRLPEVGVDGEMLISDLTFSHGGGGSTTKVTLVRPGSYSPEPAVQDDDVFASGRSDEVADDIETDFLEGQDR